MPTVPDIHRRGTRALQPLATAVTTGTLYFVTDEALTERSDGAVWQAYGGGPPVVVLAQLTDLQAEEDALRARVAALEAP